MAKKLNLSLFLKKSQPALEIKNMPKVSVIVPFYNVEGYIEKCLETLVSQTLKDIEIILVNDGSKDRSIDIVKKFLKQYPEKIVYLEKVQRR